MDDVIDELKNIIERKSSGDIDDFLLMNDHYTPIKIDKKNFHPIQDFRPELSNSRWLIIDGGNSIIFDSPSFCLGLIRVAGLVYEANKRISRNISEFYVLITEVDGKYIVKTFPETSFNGLVFDPADDLLKIGKEKCTISRIVSVIRRFAELEHAYALDKDDIGFIILDGTLEARYPHEIDYLNKLYLTGKAAALSKTCALTTKQGFSITKKLLDMSQDGASWYYYPIVINNNPEHNADIYFIRLYGKSDYVFRFELQKGLVDGSIFSLLSMNSKDPIFLGYPYGFIDVDQNARINDEESKMLATRLAAKLGKSWNTLAKTLNSVNAHDILDKIRF